MILHTGRAAVGAGHCRGALEVAATHLRGLVAVGVCAYCILTFIVDNILFDDYDTDAKGQEEIGSHQNLGGPIAPV